MLVDKNTQALLTRLFEGKAICIPYHGEQIVAKFACQHSKLALSTLVFSGGNFIPSSVRTCLNGRSPFGPSRVRTYLTLDETTFQVKLNYLGHTETLNQVELSELVEEFDLIAEKWRRYLEQRGNNDLIYIKVV